MATSRQQTVSVVSVEHTGMVGTVGWFFVGGNETSARALLTAKHSDTRAHAHPHTTL